MRKINLPVVFAVLFVLTCAASAVCAKELSVPAAEAAREADENPYNELKGYFEKGTAPSLKDLAGWQIGLGYQKMDDRRYPALMIAVENPGGLKLVFESDDAASTIYDLLSEANMRVIRKDAADSSVRFSRVKITKKEAVCVQKSGKDVFTYRIRKTEGGLVVKLSGPHMDFYQFYTDRPHKIGNYSFDFATGK
ncbi:MAG: hypothetical protein WCS77_04050 [Elusimicrobiaceae bacterium]